ncbi:MAG: hypothetical protein EZS28_052810, partial [Streblomastix strix]
MNSLREQRLRKLVATKWTLSTIKAVSKVGHGLSWVNDHVVKPYVLPAAKQFSGIIPGGGLIMKGIEAGSSALDAF